MPPNYTGKKTRANQTDCLVCEKVISEPDYKNDGHDAVFCEGDCQGWIHGQCTGLTRPAFDKLGQSTIPYLCSFCALTKQQNKIYSLKDAIKTLLNKHKSTHKRDDTSQQSMLLSHPTSSSNVQLQPQYRKDDTSKEKLQDTSDSLHSDHQFGHIRH